MSSEDVGQSSSKSDQTKDLVPLKTLADLLTMVQQKAKTGTSQYDIIEWICRVATRHGIRVRYDDHITELEKAEPSASESERVEVASDQSTPAEAPTPVTTAPVTTAPVTTAPAPAPAPTTPAPDQENKNPATKRHKKGKPVPVEIYRKRDGTRVIVLEQILNPRQFAPPVDPSKEENKNPDLGGEVLTSSSAGKESGSCRLVLSCGRRNLQMSTPLCAECNGAVLDARTWLPLAIPPRAFNPKPSPRAVDSLLHTGKYDLIHVDDGTVVTIYRWNHPKHGPIWDLATSNGYGVSNLRWMGSKTYAEVVFEIASLYTEFIQETKAALIRTPDGETRIDFGNLDPEKCYTVGFRHHDFHPLVGDPQRMWQIQSANLATGKISYGGDGGLPGIPHQVMGDPTRLASEIFRGGLGRSSLEKYVSRVDASAHGRPRDPNLKFDHLADFGADSLEIAKRYIGEKKGERAADGSRLPVELHYGFILRSRDPSVTGENSDVLIESSLLKKVRQIVYERPPKSMRDQIDHKTRLEFNAVRSHLTTGDGQAFADLFPQWRDVLQGYDEFINNVIHMIRHMHRQRAIGPSSRSPAMRTPTTMLAKDLLEHIMIHDPIAPFNKDSSSVIRDWVVNPEYSLLFMRAMARG